MKKFIIAFRGGLFNRNIYSEEVEADHVELQGPGEPFEYISFMKNGDDEPVLIIKSSEFLIIKQA